MQVSCKAGRVSEWTYFTFFRVDTKEGRRRGQQHGTGFRDWLHSFFSLYFLLSFSFSFSFFTRTLCMNNVRDMAVTSSFGHGNGVWLGTLGGLRVQDLDFFFFRFRLIFWREMAPTHSLYNEDMLQIH